MFFSAFGIDFGDYRSVVCAPLTSFFEKEAIPADIQSTISCAYNREKSRYTLTRILLSNKERLIGEQAMSKNAITAWKHKFGLFQIHKSKHLQSKNGIILLDQPYFKTNYEGTGTSSFSIEQITAMFLRKLIQNANYPADIPPTFLHPPPFVFFLFFYFSFFYFFFIIINFSPKIKFSP